jgi:hypothetical protein
VDTVLLYSIKAAGKRCPGYRKKSVTLAGAVRAGVGMVSLVDANGLWATAAGIQVPLLVRKQTPDH